MLSYYQTAFEGKSSISLPSLLESTASCWTCFQHLLIMNSSWKCALFFLHHKATLTNAVPFQWDVVWYLDMGPATAVNHKAFPHRSNCALSGCLRQKQESVIVCMGGLGGREGGRGVDGIIVALGLCTVHKITLRHRTAGVITCHTTVLVITLERGYGLIG